MGWNEPFGTSQADWERVHGSDPRPKPPSKFCEHPECAELATHGCEICDARFCSDHGSKGGDRETEGGLVADPAVCWKCGGFNVDE